jgi:hypothetical protein
MPSTVNHGALEELRQALEFLVENLPADRHPALVEAVRGLVAGIDYRDQTLMGSHWRAMREAIADTADEEIQEHVRMADRVRDFCARVQAIDACPGKELDQLGNAIGELFARLAESIGLLKTRWVKLAHDVGTEVPKEPELDAIAVELDGLKGATLNNWPWSSLGLPAVDRAMVERSRAARARGEGKPVEDLIRGLSGRPAGG